MQPETSHWDKARRSRPPRRSSPSARKCGPQETTIARSAHRAPASRTCTSMVRATLILRADGAMTTFGAPGWNGLGGTTIPSGLIDSDPGQAGDQPPSLSCCALPTPLDPVGSQMGFWYRYASPGPYFPCVTSSGTPPNFDTVSGTPDNTINQSRLFDSDRVQPDWLPVQLYDTQAGSIAWNGTKLTISGTVFIRRQRENQWDRHVRRRGHDRTYPARSRCAMATKCVPTQLATTRRGTRTRRHS